MPDWKDYAKALWRDSFVLWERGRRITVFAGIVLGSLLLGVFLVLGVAITFKPIAGFWMSVVLLLWLVFLVLVVSPYRVWSREKEKVKAFEEAFKPKINIDWRFNEKHLAELIVTNVSIKTIREIDVIFANFKKGDGTSLKDVVLSLKSADGKAYPISLNPGVPTYFPFAKLEQDTDSRTIIMLLPNNTRVRDKECGVKLRISGEDIPSHRIDLRLKQTDDNSLLIDAWDLKANAVGLEAIT